MLHDIGKFYYRTGKKHSTVDNLTKNDFGHNGAHAKWSHEFINKYFNSIIADIALYHHNPKKSEYDFTQIVQNADHHSSIERIKDDKKNNVFTTPLQSIWSEIIIKENKEAEKLYVPLRKIDLKCNLIPKSKNKKSLKEIYKKLWDEFEKEVKSLQNPYDFNTMLALLRKYTSTMPSAVYVSKPDISLYDHSKTTAALAVCRYLYQRDVEKLNISKDVSKLKVYLAVNGDISGIQKFIFKISSPQEAQSGMSKRLRGRSLYLTLLNDAIASRIIKDLELTAANILFCGGGRFTIIAPNTDKAKEKLAEIKNKINKYFINEFNAELYLSLVSQECCGRSLADFGKITKILSNKLTEDKKHKFVNQLEDVFSDDEVKYDDVCSVCGKLYHKSSDDEFRCPTCQTHEDLGRKVANSKYMIKCYLKEYKEYKRFSFVNEELKIAYIFESKGDKIKKDIKEFNDVVENFEIIKLNDTDFLDLENAFDLDDLDKISFSFSFIGNTVPKYSDKYPLYFEHLAKISKGANKLGILKMDVDDLGLVFSSGFNQLEKGSSISRVSTLSSSLDLFFSGMINKIASEPEPEYVVYRDISASSEEYFDLIELDLQEEGAEPLRVYKKKDGVKIPENDLEALKNEEIPTIHINYSGGDDLLVLGPYDNIIDFAKKFRTEFKSWTANNNSINISAGISIISPKFPIGKAVHLADNYLEASKSCGKDKITVFGEVVNWEDNIKTPEIKGFNNLFKFAQDLEKYNFERRLSTGFIFSLLKIWENSFNGVNDIPDNKKMWDEINHSKISTKRFIPLFKYKLRLIKDKEVRTKLDEKAIKFMPWIKIPVSWASLRMR